MLRKHPISIRDRESNRHIFSKCRERCILILWCDCSRFITRWRWLKSSPQRMWRSDNSVACMQIHDTTQQMHGSHFYSSSLSSVNTFWYVQIFTIPCTSGSMHLAFVLWTERGGLGAFKCSFASHYFIIIAITFQFTRIYVCQRALFHFEKQSSPI